MVIALPPRPLTSPLRPYKRRHTPPPPSPQPFAAFLIVSLTSQLHVHEGKALSICFSAAGVPPSPHRPLKPRVSFPSFPSPHFSSRGELFVVVASYGESSGELLCLCCRESIMDCSLTAGPLLCEPGSPVFLMKTNRIL
jgi:hypothetical protein